MRLVALFSRVVDLFCCHSGRLAATKSRRILITVAIDGFIISTRIGCGGGVGAHTRTKCCCIIVVIIIVRWVIGCRHLYRWRLCHRSCWQLRKHQPQCFIIIVTVVGFVVAISSGCRGRSTHEDHMLLHYHCCHHRPLGHCRHLYCWHRHRHLHHHSCWQLRKHQP